MNLQPMVWKCFAVVVLLFCAWLALNRVTGARSASDYQVVPIIFVPTDYTQHFNNREIVDFYGTKVREAQRFFAQHNNGKTFRAAPVQVVYARHDHSWYWRENNRNFEHGVIAELQSRGYPTHLDWNRVPSNRIAWVLAMGGGGWAGARQHPNGGGFAMWGDAVLFAGMDLNCRRVQPVHPGDEIKKICENSWFPGGKIYGFGVGAAIHELGHAFGLPHPPAGAADGATTVMSVHWDYPQVGLRDAERKLLSTNPFLSVTNNEQR